jgi:hypothetical protein
MEENFRQSTFVVECNEIRALRMACLRAKQKYRQEWRSILYVHEACLHIAHIVLQEWTDGSTRGLEAPLNKGQWLLIVRSDEVHHIQT